MSDTLPFSTAKIEGLARSIEAIMDAENPAQIIGKDLTQLAARIPSEQQVTPGAVVRLSLLNDTLCVAERAIKTDGLVSAAEIDYVGPLVGETQKYLGRFRELYRDVDAAGEHGVRHFLEQHASDGQKFGGRCKSTAWIGLSLCQRAAELTGDQHFVEDYRDLVVRMLDDLFGDIGSGNQSDKQAVVQELNRLAPPVAPEADLRELAYCSANSPEVFHAVAHGADVFEPDPLDVEKIHAEARTSFSRLLQRASDASHGKMLLVKGVAGSGKTHLMRAFRNHVHGGELGFVAYLQMSTRVANYARYVLANLIDSWDRPYYGNVIGDPAITCLSDSLVRDLPRDAGEQLRSETLADSELDLLVNRSADRLLSIRKYNKLNVDLLRALLYLQRRDPPRRARVLKFLRCEPFSAYDRQLLGGVTGPEDEHAPARMLTDLGQLVNATGNGALVLLVDQLEDIYHLDEAPNRFRVAMDALRHITDHVPTSIIVIACLDDFYTHLRSSLAKPMLDRLEHDPDPVTLTASRSRDEIEEIIEPRLQRLFEHHAVRIREDQPLFPFNNAELDALVNQRTRDVLEWCRAHHEASVRNGKIQAPSNQPATPSPGQAPDLLNLAQAWNDFWPSSSGTPQDEPEMLQLIAWALDHVGEELPSTEIAARAQGSYVATDSGAAKLVVGLCDKPPQGGALGKQVDALREQASSSQAVPVALRSSEYPRPGSSQVSQKLKGLLQDGGRRVVITDTEWRRLHALRGFMSQRPDTPEMKAWLQQDRPLLGVSAIREILDLDGDAAPPASPAQFRGDTPQPGVAERRPSPPAPTAAPANDTEPSGASFVIGQTRALSPKPVSASAAEFITHAAFLGTTKSGKTTLALNILEQLLARQVPVLMIDRKGDLCRYGAPEFWREPLADSELTARKARLQQALDVRVYTPGEPRGRGLDLPVIPSGMKELPAHERGIAAQSAASALGSMMGYGKSQADRTRLSILGKAIELVGQHASAQPMGIPQLVSLLDDEDPDLVSAVGKLDPKHFRALVENLETLRLRHDHLLRNDSERLAPEELFGKAARSGRTRLSVISTKFIGDNSAVDFWVARLLGELARWASRNPSNALQGVLFLDEADIYLPAQSKPATKEPLLDLLKRGRSAGLGVFLATQSPGDLDYRCRDNIRSWFVGRVAEKTAVDKMKPLLSESRINVGSKLALAKTGEFFRLEEGEALEFKAALSLLSTSQVPEEEILKLAASGAKASASGRVAKR